MPKSNSTSCSTTKKSASNIEDEWMNFISNDCDENDVDDSSVSSASESSGSPF